MLTFSIIAICQIGIPTRVKVCIPKLGKSKQQQKEIKKDGDHPLILFRFFFLTLGNASV